MSDDGEDPVAWLRAQVEARLALAREASAPADGHWWRRWVDAGHFDDGRPEPVGPLWSGEPVLDADGDVYGGAEIVVYDEGRPSDVQFGHIALNDPQDVIARCEAELAILDLHDQTRAIAVAAQLPHGELRIQDYMDAQRELCALVEAVRLLAGGYRHWPGYAEVWGVTPG